MVVCVIVRPDGFHSPTLIPCDLSVSAYFGISMQYVMPIVYTTRRNVGGAAHLLPLKAKSINVQTIPAHRIGGKLLRIRSMPRSSSASLCPCAACARALQLIRLHWCAFSGSESQTSTSGNGFKSGSNAPSALWHNKIDRTDAAPHASFKRAEKSA